MNYTTLEEPQLEKSIVTIGVFDGVHRGHVWLINHLLDSKSKKPTPEEFHTVVVTFDPHPKKILMGDDSDYYLTSIEQKLALLNKAGIDDVVVIPFSDEIANYTAEKFVQILDKHLGMQELWVGDDFALGKNRVGDITYLSELGETYGFTVHALPKKESDDEVVSSTAIRNLIKDSDIAKANHYLNRAYTLTGVVVKGDQRGRTIGFPTANLSIDERMLVPKFGVYAAYALVGEECFSSVVNIGIRPTFDSTELRIEAHLLDFPDRSLYGDIITLKFIEYIREELRFDGLDALMTQIQKDSETARNILS